MQEMMEPEVVAIAVSGNVPESAWSPVLDNIIEGGFVGRVLLVGEGLPTRPGTELYRDMSLVKSGAGLCLLFCPPDSMLEATEACMKGHARSIVLMATGKTEKPDEEQVAALVKLCREYRASVIGPGSIGIANPHKCLSAGSFGSPLCPGTISFVSQSGTLCSMLAGWASEAGVGISRMVDLGDGAHVDLSTMLEQLTVDDRTRVIACYLESIASGDRFVRFAEMAASNKPVVIIKSGTTTTGHEEATALRSSQLLGVDIAYAAAFDRAGVIRATTFDELTDFTLAFDAQPLPSGRRVALVSGHGGSSILAADAIEAANLELKRVSRIDRDVTDPEERASLFGEAVVEMELDADTDAILLSLSPHIGHDPVKAAERLADVRGDCSKPLLVALTDCAGAAEARRILNRARIPAYPSIGRAVAAMGALWQYSAWRSRPPRVVTHFPVNKRRVERIVNRHVRTGLGEIGEYPAKEILSAYGFNIPDNSLATSSSEAVEAAERLGFPVCLKVVSPDIIRKAPVYGVKLDLYTADQIRDAFDLILMRVKNKIPDARIEGICVERMIHKGRDVTLGMSKDPRFGPMLAFGVGSAFVEIMKDVAFHLAPISPQEAMEMLRQTRHYDTLVGGDGRGPMSMEAIVAGIQRLSQLATDFPQISRIEINPFRVGRLESDAVVVDASMLLESKR